MSTDINVSDALVGSAPGADWGSRLRLAGLRALRTFIQGVVAAFPTAGAGELVLSAPYWQTFAFALLAAATTAIASFLQNIANFLPTDPTQAAPN